MLSGQGFRCKQTPTTRKASKAETGRNRKVAQSPGHSVQTMIQLGLGLGSSSKGQQRMLGIQHLGEGAPPGRMGISTPWSCDRESPEGCCLRPEKDVIRVRTGSTEITSSLKVNLCWWLLGILLSSALSRIKLQWKNREDSRERTQSSFFFPPLKVWQSQSFS